MRFIIYHNLTKCFHRFAMLTLLWMQPWRRIYHVSDKMDEEKEERFTAVATVLQGVYHWFYNRPV